MALLLALFGILIAVTMSVSFLTAQGTTLGISRNLQNASQARYIAESGLELAVAYVRATSTWRTDQPNGTWVSNWSFAAGTITVKGEDGIDTDGDGDVDGDSDLTDDATEPMTLTVTGKASGAASIARAVLNPTPLSKTMLVYSKIGQSQPRFREWENGAWSSEQLATNVGGEPQWTILRSSDATGGFGLAILEKNKDLNVVMHDGSTWGSTAELTTDTGLEDKRVFDLAFEQLSGEALVVYRSASSVRYRTYDGSTWSTEWMASADPKWIRLVPKPSSNEILAAAVGSGWGAAAIWNGTAISGAYVNFSVSGHAYDGQAFDLAYESVSKHGLVAYAAEGLSTPRYRTLNGSTWGSDSTAPSVGSTPLWIKLAPDPASDKIMMVVLGNDKHLDACHWGGSSWGTNQELETNVEGNDRRMFDVAYEGGGTEALLVYQQNDTTLRYQTWSGSAWSSEQSAGTIGSNKAQVIQAVTGSSAGEVFVTLFDGGNDVISLHWDGSSFGALNTLETSSGGNVKYESFMVAGLGSGGYTYSLVWSE